MAEVLFYHLTEATLEEALPALLERSLQRGWNVVIQTGTEERRDGLDLHLWTYRDESFLAHATDRAEHAAENPVVLTCGANNPNGATIRFLVDGATPPDLTGYERGVFMFDGHDPDQLNHARAQWKAQKAAGHDLTYWQQTPERRWVKKA